MELSPCLGASDDRSAQTSKPRRPAGQSAQASNLSRCMPRARAQIIPSGYRQGDGARGRPRRRLYLRLPAEQGRHPAAACRIDDCRIARGAARAPRRELLTIMRASLDVIDRYREAFAVLNHEVRYLARRPQYRAALNQITSGYKGALADVLERGRAMGVMRFESIPTMVEAIHMLNSGWAGPLAITDKETYWR